MNRKKEISGPVLFSETQAFRVKWLWVLLISCMLIAIFLPLMIAWINKQGLKEAVLSLLITVPIETVVLYLFYVVKLETIVRKDGVYYRWRPFFTKYNFIAGSDIETEIVDDGPILSYGFHFILGYGWVHNTGPGKGIRFNLIGGKRIFIGSHDINSFQSAVDKMITGRN